MELTKNEIVSKRRSNHLKFSNLSNQFDCYEK